MRLPCLTLSFCLPVLVQAAAPAEWESLEKTGQWKRLRGQVEQRVKAQPGDADAQIFLAKIRGVFGDPQGAQQAAKRATELAPGSADAWAYYAAFTGELAGRVSMFKAMGMAGDIRSSAEKALALNPNHKVALQVLAGYHEQAPSIAGGDKKKAVALRETLQRVDPDEMLLQPLREALKAKDAGRIDAALNKAIQARPKEVWPYVNAASIYLDAERGLRAADAEKAARAALALEPANAKVMGYAAAACAAQGKWKDVDDLLARNEKQRPEDLQAYYLLGRHLVVWNRDLPRAEACFRRYLGQDPEGGAPSRANAHWRLGQALEKQGRKPEAVEQLKIALKCDANHKEAKADLKRLG